MKPDTITVDPKLHDEAGRVAALRAFDIMDTSPEEPFDNVVNLVRTILGVRMATVSLIDEDRQWFKARVGLDETETARGDSFCTHTIGQRDPMIVTDATHDTRFADNPFVLGAPFVRSYAGVPLETADGYNVGTLCAFDPTPRLFKDSEIAILANFARIVVNELELRRIARRDQLTGALTRRGFLEKAANEIARFARHQRPAALAMIDIDHFKSVNDTWGHAAGDAVLTQLPRVLEVVRRPVDVLGRLGGEEFALLLPETSVAEAMAAVERLRENIAATPMDIGGGRTVSVTVSIGVAPLALDLTTPEAWIAAADAPLYEAKRGGRNRTLAAG